MTMRNTYVPDLSFTWMSSGAAVLTGDGMQKMFTFSHDSCSRNHDRYTRCCYHYNEGHRGDALTCRKCNTDHDVRHTLFLF